MNTNNLMFFSKSIPSVHFFEIIICIAYIKILMGTTKSKVHQYGNGNQIPSIISPNTIEPTQRPPTMYPLFVMKSFLY